MNMYVNLLRLLESPYNLGTLQLKNRVAMAPMTQESSRNHIPGPLQVEHYKQRAAGGVGLIITEGTVIGHPSANGHHDVPLMYSQSALQGWQKVVDEVHKYDSKIFAQLWHVGGVRHPSMSPVVGAPAVSPSGYSAPGVHSGNALSIKEIDVIIEAYADAANNAKQCGFDGIEVHGAHGYLIDQFLWKATNCRTDHYGFTQGSRFAQEVVKAIRQRVGNDFVIGFRWSQWKIQDFSAQLFTEPAELAVFLEGLVDAGVDLFHTSTRRFWEPAFGSSDKTLAGWTKSLTGKPCIAVGGVGSGNDFLRGGSALPMEQVLAKLERCLDKQEFDVIALGRALLRDPAWFSEFSRLVAKH